MRKSLDIIKKTVQILDSVSYKNYSNEKIKTYPEYMEGSRADEDKLISPILLHKFLEQVLHFEFGKTIATQESKGVGKPDYIPVDIRTHPFVFDAKGTDTQRLSQHYPQIKRYIEPQGLKYGILTNMRDLDVYTSEEAVEIEEYNFNFVKLCQDYKQNSIASLEEENTKRFLNFVKSFSYTPLTKEEKLERIAKAKPWSGEEELNVKTLTDQLRHIVNILHNAVRDKKSELMSIAEVGGVSAKYIACEIEKICAHISGKEMEEVNAESFNKIMDVEESTLYGKARDAFFRRVAYFAMTRLLLTRVWEDIGFIDQSLYDGGFAKLYNNLNRAIGDVLAHAFRLASKHYPWLFNERNNYYWYEPSDDALIDSLYELSNFYLGKLDQDILGTIYEDYIEEVDKKNKGQYYTPREIVRFIWDRVGFNNPKAFFWHTNGKRKPNFIFDPATGSGGFLVEAARRIRECSDFDLNDPQDLQDIYQVILWGIFGCEISPFPYYLTQVNLLIQLTPVIRRILELTGRKPSERPTPLGVICRDSMELHNEEQKTFLEEGIKGRKEKYEHEILHFTISEEKIYEKIKEERAGIFSYCCSNPPYVGEKGHKELFRQTLRSHSYWKEYYQGKMDYLHWFIILGLSKLRNYGKLGFITSAYWPTADGASKLRKYILENAKIKEMIFFEEVKIFEHAKGQCNIVFVLTKCSGEDKKEERENNHIRIVQVKCKNQDLPGKTIRESLDFLTKHIQNHTDKPRYEDDYIKVFWSGVKQRELPKDGRAWNLRYSQEEKKILRKIEEGSEDLGKACRVNQGIVSGADKVTKRNIGLLPQNIVQKHNIKPGDGIFVLSQEEVNMLNLGEKEKEILKPFYKNSDIDKYCVSINNQNPQYVIYTTTDTKLSDYPIIKGHLEKFKPILGQRLESYRENYQWFELHRQREQSIFEDEKIVNPQRAQGNTFGYSDEKFYAMSDVFFITKRSQNKEALEYILGLLNSSLLDFYTKKCFKFKGGNREYVGTPLSTIPIQRINFDNPEEVEVHKEIVAKVKAIRKRMAELSKYSKYFSGFRLIRLPLDASLPKVNDGAIIKSLASENIRNLHTHPEIRIEKPKGFEGSKFYIRKITEPELVLTGSAQLKLTGKDKSSIFVNGPYELLQLLANILNNWNVNPWSEIKESLLLPDTIQSFNTQKSQILNKVHEMRSEVCELQKKIDKMVYGLYEIGEEERRIIEGE
jgi:hypothetical protein